MDNLGKIGTSLMDNWGEIRQLINILFCGYRRLEIADPRTEPIPILARGTGAPASNNPRSRPPARIERWMMRLQPFNFKVIYSKGSLIKRSRLLKSTSSCHRERTNN